METDQTFADMDDLDTADLAQPGDADYFADQIERAAWCVPKGARNVPRNAELYAPCKKCGGRGKWSPSAWSSFQGDCFKCKGTGNGLSLAPAAVAARARVAAKASAAAIAKAETILAFLKARPDIQKWWNENRARFEFAKSTEMALCKFGVLTPGQLAGIEKCLGNDANRAKADAARSVNVSGEGFIALLAAFAKAAASGLKYPTLTFDTVTFKLASAKSKCPGAIFVTGGRSFGSAYYGKVSREGAYLPSRDATPEVIAEVKRIGADPLGQVVAHGLKTGNCACCNRELTDPVSVGRGIGPICFNRFFG